MRYLPLILLIILIGIPSDASARSAVLLVVDALGSSYLPRHTAAYAGGGIVEPIPIAAFERAEAQYQLRAPVPATEYGHAVIVTGCANASGETVALYHATVFDALRDDGYIALGILENGDSKEMLGEMDAVIREKNGSVYNPYFEFYENGGSVPDGVVKMMNEYPRLLPTKAGKDPYAPYIRYNSWGLGFARALVKYMNESEPDTDYVLIVNVGGLDSAGHKIGYDGYRAVLTSMDSDIGALVDTCNASGTVLMVTGDHGMSFPDGQKRGSHAAPSVASRNESVLVPLLIYSNASRGPGGTYGQECLAPTLLSLLDEPNSMSLSDGEPLPVKDRPTLFLRSKSPITADVTGGKMNTSVTIDGLCRITGLEKGAYTVHYDNVDRTIRLDHDELVDLSEAGRGASPIPPWMAYSAAATLSIVGIAAALALAWARK